MTSSSEQLPKIIEAAILVAGHPVTLRELQKLFDESETPSTEELRIVIGNLQEKYADSGIELREVASGYQFQARTELSPWLGRLWEERAPRYSRAFLETLALIAYRQPITRAEIEDIRGVAVSSHIFKTLQEREWIRLVGYRDVPGKPGLYGTTKTFLDHFNLKNLAELPTLAELKDLDTQEAKLHVQLELGHTDTTESEEPVLPEEATAIESEQPMLLEETTIIESEEPVLLEETTTTESEEPVLSEETTIIHE